MQSVANCLRLFYCTFTKDVALSLVMLTELAVRLKLRFNQTTVFRASEEI